MRRRSGLGFTPFIVLSVLIHALAAFALAAYLDTPASKSDEGLRARSPVRVRLGESVPSVSPSEVTPPPQSVASARSTRSVPSITAIPQKEQAQQSLEPTARAAERPPQITPAPNRPDLPDPLKADEVQEPEILPETLPRLHTRAEVEQTLANGKLTLSERPSKTTVEPLADQGKAARKPTVGLRAERGKSLQVPKIDRIPSAVPPPPVRSLETRGQVAKVEPAPRADQQTVPRASKPLVKARKMTLAKTTKPAQSQTTVYSPGPFSPLPRPASQKALEKTSAIFTAPANVSDLVRLRHKEKTVEEPPRSAMELLSSLDIRMNKPRRPAAGDESRPKKKARLAPLMTQDVRYRGYRYTIWKRIDDRLFYPDAAAKEKVRGKVIVRFEVTRDGQLATLKLVKSSGYALFDEEALMAVRRAAPFPKFPPTISGNRLAIKSEILYEP